MASCRGCKNQWTRLLRNIVFHFGPFVPFHLTSEWFQRPVTVRRHGRQNCRICGEFGGGEARHELRGPVHCRAGSRTVRPPALTAPAVHHSPFSIASHPGRSVGARFLPLQTLRENDGSSLPVPKQTNGIWGGDEPETARSRSRGLHGSRYPYRTDPVRLRTRHRVDLTVPLDPQKRHPESAPRRDPEPEPTSRGGERTRTRIDYPMIGTPGDGS